MEARPFRLALCAALFVSICPSLEAGNARSANFIVQAPTKQFAQKVCSDAEALRKSLALEWLGYELPRWREPIPIRVLFRSGAGGVTSFAFRNRVPGSWTMEIQGSKERILDSVLPHEITHTIFATHFGQQLPRWADEGACTTVEHVSERRKQDYILDRNLKSNKGIPFNRMFRMMEYPRDMLTIYSQGYSVCRFLIAQGGKKKFVKFIKNGLDTRNWDGAIKKHYSFKDLSELQLTWNDWVGRGSPALPANAGVRVADAAPANAGVRVADAAQFVSASSEPAAATPKKRPAPRRAESAATAEEPAPRSGFETDTATYQAPQRGKLLPIDEPAPAVADRSAERGPAPGLALNAPEVSPSARDTAEPRSEVAGNGGWYSRVRDGRATARPTVPVIAPRADRIDDRSVAAAPLYRPGSIRNVFR